MIIDDKVRFRLTLYEWRALGVPFEKAKGGWQQLVNRIIASRDGFDAVLTPEDAGRVGRYAEYHKGNGGPQTRLRRAFGRIMGLQKA